MRLLRTMLAAFVAICTMSAIAPAFAQQTAGGGRLHVDIEEGHLNPMPVATPDFLASNSAAQQIGRDVASVIRADLERSALFRPIDQNAFIERIQDLNVPPRFADWKIIDAQALVVGQVTPLPDGRVRIEFRLWDVFAEQSLTGFQYATTPDNWRRIAHRIADQIYEQLTGERGYFDTRIVFVSETGPRTRRIKRLMVMDQDGANPFFLTGSESMVLTPRFSPSAQMITYMSFETGAPRVFLYNLETNRREVLGDFPGMTFAPRFQAGRNRRRAHSRYERELRDFLDGPALAPAPAPHQSSLDRHFAIVFARLLADHLQFRSRRHAADLRDER